MVTGKSPHHYPYAVLARTAFLEQTYPLKQLVIVNDGEHSLDINDSRIKEVKVERKPQTTLGQLRNIGLEHADGDWILQWDDDDIHHPARMDYQMSHVVSGKCQLLVCQVRTNVLTGDSFKYTEPIGIAGTILHPKTTERYPLKRKGEDGDFWLNTWGRNNRQLKNNIDFPEVYIRLYHGHNTWDEGHIMKGVGSAGIPPDKRLTQAQTDYVREQVSWYTRNEQ